MAVTAVKPSGHSPVISMSGSFCSRLRIRSRASGSSSTMRARIFMRLPRIRPLCSRTKVAGLRKSCGLGLHESSRGSRSAARRLVDGQPVVTNIADDLGELLAVGRLHDIAVRAQPVTFGVLHLLP